MKSMIAVLLLAVLQCSNAACPDKCAVTLLSRFPEVGYRASINLKAPAWYKPKRPFLITLVFDGDLKMIENLHIPGGSLRPKLSNITKNQVKLRFRPDQAIRKGSQVKIEYLIRDKAMPANLVEVKFWKRVACSSKPCDPNATTPVPPSTAAPKPTMFPTCRGTLKVTQTGPSFFKGVLSVPVLKAMSGWKLELLFDKMVRISNFPAKLVEKRRRRYFVLENLPADKDIDAGTFKFLILVHFNPNLFKRPQLAMIKLGSYECRMKDNVKIPPTRPPGTKPSKKPPTKGPGPKSTKKPAPKPETEEPATVGPVTEKPVTEGPGSKEPTGGPTTSA